jgi:hypothetical protein
MPNKALPRKEKDKKPVKPHRYSMKKNVSGSRTRKYFCPEHERQHVLTKKQVSGESPIKCEEHEFSHDFRWIERWMRR